MMLSVLCMYSNESFGNKKTLQLSIIQFITKPSSQNNNSFSDHPVNPIYLLEDHIDKTGIMQVPRERQKEPISKGMERFQNSIHSRHTRITYMRYLLAFLEFIQKNHLELIAMDVEDRQWALEKWVLYLNSKGSREKTTRTCLAAVEKFLDINRCVYFKKPLHALIQDGGNDEISGRVPYANDEINRMLEYAKKLRTVALIHFYKDTGARTSAIVDPVLRMKHLFDMPDGCYAIRIYDESKTGYSESSKSGYWVFLTPEGRRALDNYLDYRRANGEKITAESPLFASSSSTHDHLKVDDVYRIFSEMFPHVRIKRVKVDDTPTGKCSTAVVYGFRKRFNTILIHQENIKQVVIDRLMGHKGKVSERYYRPTKEELFLEFKKVIPYLTVGTAAKLQLELEEKNKKLSELFIQEEQNKELNSKVQKLERALLDKVLEEK